MLRTIELKHTRHYPLLRLEKNEHGLYPVPTMRCGILPYIRQGNDIIWGCVRSNRVGPVTITLPAGTQDIHVIKDERRFSLEVGKPFPDLEYDFLAEFVGKLFRDQIYQDIVTRLMEHQFEVYAENPLVTALHETREEHGVDLRKEEGRDHHLLNRLIQLPVQSLSGKRGANAQSFWVAALDNLDGIVLSDTVKVENKIRRNFGRVFYEQGCWGTLSDFKNQLKEARTYSSHPTASSHQSDLINGVLEAYEENIELLERIELLIRADFLKSAFPRGLHPFFSSPPKRHKQDIQEVQTIKSALRTISYDTWFVLDLDNTVMESTLELGSDQWFTYLADYALKTLPEPREAMRLTLLIYSAVQAHTVTRAVEPGMISIIKALQDIGIPVLALTARDITIKQSTVLQLAGIGIDFSRNCIDVSDDSYEQGIIFCNGKNKGTVWQEFMKKCPKNPAHIVMLDDKKRHLERMSDAAKALGVNFTGLRYGFLDEKISSFDMKLANHQLAYLTKELPEEVQDAIVSLKLVPHLHETSYSDSLFSSSFFNPDERVGFLSEPHVRPDSSRACSSVK
ncbi:hypothetical protein Lmor_2451 [Legionella moravica]|uniref:Protein of uncharacterized function (DUF2608) n=1 Tax=Legionella moravica TaxID=39962 RepID=A0A378JYB1_9GAMM|nr:DUF2608 domain-containing protein [Legionella moravica]KTD32111.1 hypothetical protein Lmor_2451 [Legionella moravica]STX63027.1 Protein of uncharacterised function (DUF2608) [Legionella moravica]